MASCKNAIPSRSKRSRAGLLPQEVGFSDCPVAPGGPDLTPPLGETSISVLNGLRGKSGELLPHIVGQAQWI